MKRALSCIPVIYNRANTYVKTGDHAKAKLDFAEAERLGYKS